MIALQFMLCLGTGFLCYWLFYKCIDWFENL